MDELVFDVEMEWECDFYFDGGVVFFGGFKFLFGDGFYCGVFEVGV